ncbi:formyltransferase family protein [Caloranaerobacter azorensis]|uniref:Methionyl-tRNA formyltransferase n=1 Tax=Caloranaerobacter azorensis TaxID=116090 RepID=A0A6P1YH11_9FIRM|nr:formyltransferase family protein [Caloranaerobacter azorensis]QIB27495.1 methionyl-tRNA formyltransferase [Caloranaerobacter azorensis]
MKVIIATIKSWNIKRAVEFKKKNERIIETHIITDKNELTYEKVKKINPKYIFFPHWSWIIPQNIYDNFTCIVFHMTDLPFGRGGSPLQNLIERGIENTKISAIKVDGGIDTGDIYLKKDLNLNGTAEEIYIRASKIIFNDMIPEIIAEQLIPKPQKGEVVEFKRRKPEQSEIKPELTIEQIYDYIRMLDAEEYPKAFIKFGKYRLEFSRASFKSGKIIADVEIKEVESHE